MIYNTNVGGPGKSGPLAKVWKWLCEIAAENLPQLDMSKCSYCGWTGCNGGGVNAT